MTHVFALLLRPMRRDYSVHPTSVPARLLALADKVEREGQVSESKRA